MVRSIAPSLVIPQAAPTAVDQRYWNAAEVKADAKRDEEKAAQKLALQRANAKQQMSYLNMQVQQQKEQAARDPGASEMTPLEASLNKSLLVSIVQHKYPNANVLN